jgi:hypothetical protein
VFEVHRSKDYRRFCTDVNSNPSWDGVILSAAKDLCGFSGASRMHGSFALLRMTGYEDKFI